MEIISKPTDSQLKHKTATTTLSKPVIEEASPSRYVSMTQFYTTGVFPQRIPKTTFAKQYA